MQYNLLRIWWGFIWYLTRGIFGVFGILFIVTLYALWNFAFWLLFFPHCKLNKNLRNIIKRVIFVQSKFIHWPLTSEIYIFFVRDWRLSSADYNPSHMGVGVVIVKVVVAHFHDGITWERFELSSWFFAWWLVMTICFESEFGSQFHPCRPVRPAKSLFLGKIFTMG